MTKRIPDFLSTLSIVAIALLASVVFAGACARRETVASKSAAAYDAAVAKGLPIGSGHGGHGPGAVASRPGGEPPDAAANPMAGMDHADPTASAGGHDHSTGMEPSKTAGHDAGAVHAMDHSRMPGHELESPADGSDVKRMAGAAHDHGAETGHPDESAPDPAEAPDSNAERIQLDPEATLRQDGLDAPASSSVAEAQKAGGAAHSDHDGAADGPADPRPAPPPGNTHHSAPPAPEGTP